MELVFGLILLLAGGDMLVRGSVTVARKFGISELMIGLTLVGFGTSTPELVTSINAALAASPGIAVGNIVGSNIANILLILGLTAAIYPITCQSSAIKRDGIALITSALCCVGIALYGELTLVAGMLYITLILAYVAYTYLKERFTQIPSAKLHRDEVKLAEPLVTNIWFGLLMAIAGITLTILGARLLVESAVELARAHSISESTIGLTIVAVGTSLPEMVTSMIAALKKNTAIALGNILGSNIYNIWFILGLTAVIQPIPVPKSIIGVDIWVMLSSSLLLIWVLWKWKRISRLCGILFLLLYSVYVLVMMYGL